MTQMICKVFNFLNQSFKFKINFIKDSITIHTKKKKIKNNMKKINHKNLLNFYKQIILLQFK